jgi:chromosome segregation ATPase
MSEVTCPFCGQKINNNWKYCRFCGEKVEVQTTKNEIKETPEEITEVEEVKEDKVVFDKNLYFSVLSTRSRRREISRKRSELLSEVNALLDQVKNGLTSKEYATSKIKEYRAEVDKLNKENEKFASLPDTLPIETLIDEIEAAEDRLEKLKDIKANENISKETIKDANRKYEENLALLRDQQSKINGHLRLWVNQLKSDLTEKRKELEMLYVKKEMGEITDEVYQERKTNAAEKITELDNVVKTVEIMLKV